MARSLYITYDGLTDPLGQSQILPYLKGLSELGHEVHIISCEKPERFQAKQAYIQRLTKDANLHWHPIPYTAKPPIFSTLKDVRTIFRVAEKLQKSKPFDLVHCRSYIAALAGLSLKRKYSVPFLFDMRGFWVEERTEGGVWNLNVPWYKTVFNYFKKKERNFLSEADHVIVLTDKAKTHLQFQFKVPEETISVIPCCADEQHFHRNAVSRADKEEMKTSLSIQESDMVMGYLGSLGTWYALNEMIDLFDQIQASQPNAHFVLASNDAPPTSLTEHPQFGKRIHCITLDRDQVPVFLSLLNTCIYFIRPTFSKTASCPTKLGEALLMGVPVITNPGIGDIASIMKKLECGLLVDMEAPELEGSRLLHMLQQVDPERLAHQAREYFGLNSGVDAYHTIYTAISNASS